MKVETTSTYYNVAILFTQQHSLVTVSLIDWPPMELIKFWHNWNSTKLAKICYETVRIKVIIWSIWNYWMLIKNILEHEKIFPLRLESTYFHFFPLWIIHLNFKPQFYHFPVKFSKIKIDQILFDFVFQKPDACIKRRVEFC